MIRQAEQGDFNFIYYLYMHPQINPYLLYEPMDGQYFQPIFQDLLQHKVLYVYEDAKQPAGMFKLVPYTHRSSHTAYLGGVAIHPDFAGKGHGHKLIKEVLDFCSTQGFLRIELSAATINKKAIHLYTSAGFKKEGVLRKYTHMKKEDRFLDEVMMAYLFE